MITTIIFDIGNVLVDFCWEEYLQSFGFSKEIEERLAKALMLSPVWDEFDRGVLSDEEMLHRFIQNDPEIEKQIRLVYKNINGILKRRSYAIPWIKELKSKGFRVLFLSNFSRKSEIECADTIDFIPYMDGGIFSYQEKLIKPDPAIYKLLLERYKLIANECVFFDDREDNCEAAKALGIHAVVFKSKESAEKALEVLIKEKIWDRKY